MTDKLVVDLRYALRDFVKGLGHKTHIPDYVLNEVVNLVFDVLIFEMENIHEEPQLSRLGQFYIDHLEPDPGYMQEFLESFFLLVKSIAGQLKAADFYSGDGFEFAPETNLNNRSIIVRRFEDPMIEA